MRTKITSSSVPQGRYAQPPILREQPIMPLFPPDYTASLIFDHTIEKISSTTPMGKQPTVPPSSPDYLASLIFDRTIEKVSSTTPMEEQPTVPPSLPDYMASLIFAYTVRHNLLPSRSSRYYDKT